MEGLSYISSLSKGSKMALFPLRIAVIYAVVGAFWILFSDELLLSLAADPLTLTRLQTFKGWLFVAVTAALLYGIIRSGLSNIRRADAEAQESKQYNRSLFELSPIGLALCRMDGAFMDVNPTFAKIIGRTVEETLTLSHGDITPEKFADQERMQLEALEKTDRYCPYEKEYIHKDGSLVPVRLQGQIIERHGEKFIWSSVEDITERKKAEEALQYHELLLRETGRIAKIGGWEFDPATGKGTWTEEVARIHDLDPDDETNIERGMSFYHSESRAKIDKAVKEAVELGKTYNLELELVTAKGTHKWVRTIGQPRIENGKVAHVRGSFQDITERKRAEEALKKSEALLQETQRITKVGGWEYDVANRKISWTDEVYCIYDISPDSYDPNNIQQDIEFYAPRDKQTIEQAFYKAVNEGEPYDLELQFITAKGRHLWVRTIGKPVLEDGKTARVVGNIMDITEQKKAEARIFRLTRLYSVLSKINEVVVRTHEPEELFRQACRIAVEDGLFRMAWIGLVDPKTLLVNPVAIHGHEDGYLKENRISFDESIPEGRGPTGSAMRTGGYFICNDIENDPIMAPWRDEALRRGYHSSAALALKMGMRIVGTLNIYASEVHFFQEEQEVRLLKTLADDISYAIEAIEADKERRQAEEALRKLASELEDRVMERTAELKESQSALMNLVEDLSRKSEELAIAKGRAEAADRTKSVFLATMSHELRTPLNSIIGFTGIMLQSLVGPLNEEQNKQLKMVQDSALHLLSLINDILDISKIEAGQVEIVAGRFDMPVLIRKTIEKFTPLTEKKGVGLTARIAADAGTIVSDRRRVEQILINLLGNAVKFTEQGEVRLECAIEGGGENGWMVIRVTDTGIGMKPEDMDAIFKPFQQIDSGITRQYDGTGLGLSICKRLVEMLGGTIWVESKWGKGSAFAFTLPLQKE